MARYIGPNGQEVEAYQLSEDLEGNFPAKKGEWIIIQDGKKVVTDPAYFVTNFKQKFPRLPDQEPQPIFSDKSIA